MYDVIVLGAGPAGLTAALYVARAKLKTLVLTGSMIGGQIAYTYQVDNYPGFPEGITGPELSSKFKAHAQRFGAELLEEEATGVDFSTSPYKVYIRDQVFEAQSVIVATGMTHRRLGVQGEDRLMGRGVFVCATCDAILYEDKKVIVVGGGDSAIQEAIDLAKFASSVTIVHRGSKLRACRCLIDLAKNNPKINILYDTTLAEIFGEKRVRQVSLKDLKTDITSLVDVEGVLLAIGWNPNTAIFRGQLEMDDKGYLKTDGVKTDKPGIFVAGDLMDRLYRQVVTSCGNGCSAALEAIQWIDEQQRV